MQNMCTLIPNAEIWNPVVHTPCIIEPMYWVSTYGRVYSFYSNRLLTNFVNQHGYHVVYLKGFANDGSRYTFGCFVHRLVMYAFAYIPGCEQLQVNHKDFNTINNHIENLEWCTPQQNTQHSVKYNPNRIFVRGEQHGLSKLTNDQVDEIVNLLLQGEPPEKIAKMFNCTNANINYIAEGKTWRHRVSPDDVAKIIEIARIRRHHLKDEQRHMICKFYEDNINSVDFTKHGEKTEFVKRALQYAGLDVVHANIMTGLDILNHNRSTDISSQYNF